MERDNGVSRSLEISGCIHPTEFKILLFFIFLHLSFHLFLFFHLFFLSFFPLFSSPRVDGFRSPELVPVPFSHRNGMGRPDHPPSYRDAKPCIVQSSRKPITNSWERLNRSRIMAICTIIKIFLVIHKKY